MGNPDEMRSNRMQQALDALKFWVTAAELDVHQLLHLGAHIVGGCPSAGNAQRGPACC
jgi:hypothetical protein